MGEVRVGPLVGLLRLNTRLYRSCLDGISGSEAGRGFGEGGNGAGFIALHVVDARFYLARSLDQDVGNPFAEYEDVRSEDEVERLPPLSALLAEWDRVSPILISALETLSADRAAGPAPTRFPIDDPSLLGMAAFLVQHESYHIGQLALLRRQLGHPPIAWS
jgi:uncharacterized damage-inducible protein DinB